MRFQGLRATGAAAAAAILLSSGASAVQLYQVDFSSPPHGVGVKPVVGTGAIPRHLPTSIYGTPLVEATSAGLEDQPLFLTGYCCSPLWDADGVTFLLSDLASYTRFGFNMDFSVEAVETNTGTLLISFGSLETIAFRWNFGTGAEIAVTSRGITTDIGPWNAEEPMHLRVVVDTVQQQWWVFRDHVQVFTDTWGYGFRPQYLQIETGRNASAALDNVVINGDFSVIPVDGASWGQVKGAYR